MSILKMISAAQPPVTNISLYDAINSSGLTSNLKLCLDAGDSASYDPAVQTAKWLDTSGNGFDFFRGSTNVTDAGDPTFNGSAGGLSSSEFWSTDGGDYFTYDAANETWMNNMHKTGALWTVFAVFKQPVTSVSVNTLMFTTLRNASGGIGVSIAQQSGSSNGGTTSSTALTIRNGTTTLVVNPFIFAGIQGQYQIIANGFDEAATTDRIYAFNSGRTQYQSTANAASPSASNADGCRVLSYVTLGTTTPAANAVGFNMACLAIWEGVRLTDEQVRSVYQKLSGRFGL